MGGWTRHRRAVTAPLEQPLRCDPAVPSPVPSAVPSPVPTAGAAVAGTGGTSQPLCCLRLCGLRVTGDPRGGSHRVRAHHQPVPSPSPRCLLPQKRPGCREHLRARAPQGRLHPQNRADTPQPPLCRLRLSRDAPGFPGARPPRRAGPRISGASSPCAPAAGGRCAHPSPGNGLLLVTPPGPSRGLCQDQ